MSSLVILATSIFKISCGKLDRAVKNPTPATNLRRQEWIALGHLVVDPVDSVTTVLEDRLE